MIKNKENTSNIKPTAGFSLYPTVTVGFFYAHSGQASSGWAFFIYIGCSCPDTTDSDYIENKTKSGCHNDLNPTKSMKRIPFTTCDLQIEPILDLRPERAIYSHCLQ